MFRVGQLETQDSELGTICLRTLYYYSTIVENFRSLRKCSGSRRLSDSDIPRAKAPRTPSSERFFLCGLCIFARDTPTFGCGFATLCLCGEYSFTVNPEELKRIRTHSTTGRVVECVREPECKASKPGRSEIGAAAGFVTFLQTANHCSYVKIQLVLRAARGTTTMPLSESK